MRHAGARVLQTFRANRQSVRDLANLDRHLVELFLTGLRELADELRDKHYMATKRIENRVLALENIQRNDSLRKYYETMFNQCVVLLVSYFGSAVHDLFREAVAHAFATGAAVNAATEEVKISWKDFAAAGPSPGEVFAEILVGQKDISFQDMQSIARAFQTFFDIQIERTADVNDLILGQAARHVIVHNAGIIDAKMLRQLAAAKPRSLKLELTAGDTVSFKPAEIETLGDKMESYLAGILEKLVRQLPSPEPAA